MFQTRAVSDISEFSLWRPEGQLRDYLARDVLAVVLGRASGHLDGGELLAELSEHIDRRLEVTAEGGTVGAVALSVLVDERQQGDVIALHVSVGIEHPAGQLEGLSLGLGQLLAVGSLSQIVESLCARDGSGLSDDVHSDTLTFLILSVCVITGRRTSWYACQKQPHLLECIRPRR